MKYIIRVETLLGQKYESKAIPTVGTIGYSDILDGVVKSMRTKRALEFVESTGIIMHIPENRIDALGIELVEDGNAQTAE